MRGRLIVIEGTDGSGKSTQFGQLCQRLTDATKNRIGISCTESFSILYFSIGPPQKMRYSVFDYS